MCSVDAENEDHLIRLETSIGEDFASKQHCISNIEKAYDTTWKYGILKDMHRIGLRGRLSQFIAQFLQNRTFQVKIGCTLSEIYNQEMGVPQGSVLSPTLFAIRVNDIGAPIPKDQNYHASLYVDDIQASYTHSDLNVITNKLQRFTNRLYKWTNTNGFKTSNSKTKVHICKLPEPHISPSLYLNNREIEYCETIKSLGIIWNRKLTFQRHIYSVVVKCEC